MEVMNGAELYDYYSSMQGAEKLQTIAMWTPELRNRDYDWWNANTHTGFAQDYHISVSGGKREAPLPISRSATTMKMAP